MATDPKQRVIESNNYFQWLEDVQKALAEGCYIQSVRDFRIGAEARFFAVVEEPYKDDQ